QNPVEYEGTFPLPEAQLDRFFMKLSLGYLDQETESQMLLNLGKEHPITKLQAEVEGQQLPELAQQVWQVHVDDTIRHYIVRLVFETRHHGDLLLGASPRGSHALYRAAQAYAAVNGRDYVLPDDVKQLAPYILAHRCIVHPESALRGITAVSILEKIIDATPLDIGELE
ncbi:MAG: MoxR family ATPase, partial [Anaerolineales bacterium]|nr:MoxR family ATPase [Anaerolineales bacterium]